MERDLTNPRGISAARQYELKERFRKLGEDLARQQRIIKEQDDGGHSSVAANTVLQLLEKEQAAILQELGYNPRTN